MRQRFVLAPVVAAAVLVVAAGLLAIHAGRAGLGFLPRLNQRDSVLVDAPTPLAEPPPRATRRVVLVIIDGLSLRYSYGQLFLDAARRRGIDAAATSHYPTISRPNYVSILTGVPPLASGVRNNDYKWRVKLDSLMDRAAAATLATAFVSDWSTGVPYMFSQDLADTTYAPWPGGFVDAARLAMSRVFPLVILLPGDVDIVGHLDGADSEEYRAAVRRVDDLLAASLPDFDFERDTLAIVADHGHVDGGGHGGVEDQVLEVPLILAGAGIDRDGLVTGARLIDVAPTVAALLGLPAPRHGLGRTLVSALDVPTETRRRIAEADTIRVSANQALLDASTQLARVYVAANRLRRVFLSISLAALAVVLLVVARRLGAVTIDWRVLLIALPAFPLAFYALLDMAGGNFSLSALPDEGVGARRVYYLGLASTGVHVLAAWIALRGRVVLRDRLAAANAIALCGMLVAGLPAALAWALYGAGPFVELPGPRMIFLIPAMYIAVSCYAVAAAATLGLEVVVFFARAVDPRQRLRRLERAMKKERIRLSSEIDLPIARDAPESGDSEPG